MVDYKVVLAVYCHCMTYFAEVDTNHLDMMVVDAAVAVTKVPEMKVAVEIVVAVVGSMVG